MIIFFSRHLLIWGISSDQLALSRETLLGKRNEQFVVLAGLCHGLGTRGAWNAKPLFPMEHLLSSGGLPATEYWLGWKGKSHSLAVFRDRGAETVTGLPPQDIGQILSLGGLGG